MTIDQILILIVAIVGVVVASFVRARYRHELIVTEGFAGLLYHDGKLVETLHFHQNSIHQYQCNIIWGKPQHSRLCHSRNGSSRWLCQNRKTSTKLSASFTR